MDELTNATRSVAYQQANPVPEPELAGFIGRVLADQGAWLGCMAAEDGRTGEGASAGAAPPPG